MKRGANASGRIFVSGLLSAGKIQSSSLKSSMSTQSKLLSGMVNFDRSAVVDGCWKAANSSSVAFLISSAVVPVILAAIARKSADTKSS